MFRDLHEGCSPSLVHKGIKSSNIFLDTELNPRLGDCGLAKFHEVIIYNIYIKIYDMISHRLIKWPVAIMHLSTF